MRQAHLLSWGFAFIAVLALYANLFKKVKKGTAIISTGSGGTRVAFDGIWIVPILHRVEEMDLSLKRIEIDRTGSNGLICKDNIRADIKVAFFVRVNPTAEDVKKVANSIGCERASNHAAIEHLFDSKFSEALKTVGKRFDFIELYEERDTFREEIVKLIGTDLNGFSLEDAAIDYLQSRAPDPFEGPLSNRAEGPNEQVDFFNSPLGISLIIALLIVGVLMYGKHADIQRNRRKEREAAEKNKKEVNRY